MRPPAQRPRRALVLAGGGIVGGMYEIGALLALDQLFVNFSVNRFDLYVGTSAGAFVAALLANRITPAQIRSTIESDPRTLPRLTHTHLLSINPWSYAAVLPKLAVQLPSLLWDLAAHWKDALFLDTVFSLRRVLPRGLFTPHETERYLRDLLSRPGRTNDFSRLGSRLLVPATVLDTGRIHVFGENPASDPPISRAVAASAAIPILFEPYRIAGVDYIDGSVSRTAHSGIAADRGADLIVIVNPVRPHIQQAETGPPAPGRAVRDQGLTAIADQAFRIALHQRLHDSLVRVRYRHPDADFLLLEPYRHDFTLSSQHLMTYALKNEIIRRGYLTTAKTALLHYQRFAETLGRHGIRLCLPAVYSASIARWSRAPCPRPTQPLSRSRRPA